MSPQLDMIGQQKPEITLPRGQTEPRFWVKRFTLWQDPEQIIRDFTLRPGLNILWSPDPMETEKPSSGSGHGSGKSLFCRLIRYCLGEPHYASEEQQERICHRFHNGLVGLEVRVDQRTWTVIRSIGPTRRDRVVEGRSVEEALVDLQHDPAAIPNLTSYLEQTVLGQEATSLLGRLNQGVPWLMALAWMSRDQECRFDHVLDWRASATSSGSPVRSMSKRHRLEIVRILLGAITAAELDIQARLEARERQRNSLEGVIPKRAWSINNDVDRLCALLSLDRNGIGELPLALQGLRAEAHKQLSEAESVQHGSDRADLSRLRERYERALSELSSLERQHSVALARKEENEGHLRKSRAMLSELGMEEELAKSPICPICEVPIDRIKAEGCSLSDKVADFEAIKDRNKKIKGDIQEQERKITDLSSAIERYALALEGQKRTVDQLSEDLRKAERAINDRREAWYRARKTKDAIDDLESLYLKNEKNKAELEVLVAEVEQEKDQVKSLRATQDAVFGRISAIFGSIVARLLGDEAEGSLALDGNGLRLNIELGGDRSTAAIESLKVIAFDMTALYLAVEGKTPLPAFLIHDSPREADMGLSIYSRLFEHCLELERQLDYPLFQYVITTTSQPPEGARQEPWLLPRLSGSPASDRLLRANI